MCIYTASAYRYHSLPCLAFAPARVARKGDFFKIPKKRKLFPATVLLTRKEIKIGRIRYVNVAI